MPERISLNKKTIQMAAVESRHALYDSEEPSFYGFSSESDAQDYGFEEGVKWALKQLGHA